MTQRPEPYERFRTDAVWNALDALRERAPALGVSMSSLALAWLLHLPEVTSVVIGPNRVEHLDDVDAGARRPSHRTAERAEIAEVFEWES